MTFLPIYAALRGVTAAQIGILVAANILLSGILQGPSGRLADKYPKVPLMIWGNLAFSTSFLLMPISPGFTALLILNIIIGLGGALSLPAITAIATQVGREYGMGSTMAVFNMAMSIGMAISPLISGVIMDTVGLSWVFYFGGIVIIMGTILFYWMVKSYKEDS